jgi:hypothetical protein
MTTGNNYPQRQAVVAEEVVVAGSRIATPSLASVQ